MAFKKASKSKSKLRLALVGPSGTGKTFTSLIVARVLANGAGFAVVDTERGSASKYAGDVADFDVCDLDTFEPLRYVKTIEEAGDAGYPVLVIDSLSHAWIGEGGALDQVDKRGGKFTAWKEVTPQHRALVDAILRYPGHVIVTMRSKTEYVVEQNSKGKAEPRKVGMAPVQRDGLEYEFDVVGDMDWEHILHITKSRCQALADEHIRKPGEKFAQTLLDWLDDGAERPADVALRMIEEGDVDGARKLAGQHKATMRRDEVAKLTEAFNALQKKAENDAMDRVADAADAAE